MVEGNPSFMSRGHLGGQMLCMQLCHVPGEGLDEPQGRVQVVLPWGVWPHLLTRSLMFAVLLHPSFWN